MTEAPLLDARSITRRRDEGGWLLREVSLAVEGGDRVAIQGPSGSGKTLLLRALALLDPLDAGEVRLRGRAVPDVQVPAFRRQVTYLHQGPPLSEGTVEANLRLPFSLAVHHDRRFERERALELLEELGRDADFLGARIDDLSGGERQMVALVRILQLDPTVLLLDEPTAALDPATAELAESLLTTWCEGEGRAFLWVSHDPAQARRVARRRLRLEGGALAPAGS